MIEANIRVHTPPDEEPVSLAEAKAHLRVDHSDEDAVISALITVAREQAEMIARRAFVERTLEVQLDCWPCGDVIELAYPPLQSVDSITYVDSAGVEHTMPDTDYYIDAHTQPGRVCLGYNKVWPSEELRPRAGITIQYVAGYGDAEDVPAIYKQAMLLLIGHFYENREEVIAAAGVSAVKLPMAAESLLLIDRGSF